MLTRRQGNRAIVVVGVVLALCLATSAVCAGGQSFILGLQMPFGYVMSFCGVWRTTPTAQFGVAWNSPYFSAALPPYGGPEAGCFLVPWLPVLPQRGALVFP